MPMVQNKIMTYCYFAVKSHTPIPINFYRVNLNWQSKKTNQVNELSVKQKIQRKIPCGVAYLPYFDYFPRNGDHVKPNTQYLKNSKFCFSILLGKLTVAFTHKATNHLFYNVGLVTFGHLELCSASKHCHQVPPVKRKFTQLHEICGDKYRASFSKIIRNKHITNTAPPCSRSDTLIKCHTFNIYVTLSALN